MSRSWDVGHPGQCMTLKKETLCNWGHLGWVADRGHFRQLDQHVTHQRGAEGTPTLVPSKSPFLTVGKQNREDTGFRHLYKVSHSMLTQGFYCKMIIAFLRSKYLKNIALSRSQHTLSNAESWPKDFFFISEFLSEPTQNSPIKTRLFCYL